MTCSTYLMSSELEFFLYEMFRNFKRNNFSTQALIYPAVRPSITVASLHILYSLCTLPVGISQEAEHRG